MTTKAKPEEPTKEEVQEKRKQLALKLISINKRLIPIANEMGKSYDNEDKHVGNIPRALIAEIRDLTKTINHLVDLLGGDPNKPPKPVMREFKPKGIKTV